MKKGTTFERATPQSATNFSMLPLSSGVKLDDDKVPAVAYRNMLLAVSKLNNEDYGKVDAVRNRRDWLTLAEGYAELCGIDMRQLYGMIR